MVLTALRELYASQCTGTSVSRALMDTPPPSIDTHIQIYTYTHMHTYLHMQTPVYLIYINVNLCVNLCVWLTCLSPTNCATSTMVTKSWPFHTRLLNVPPTNTSPFLPAHPQAPGEKKHGNAEWAL